MANVSAGDDGSAQVTGVEATLADYYTSRADAYQRWWSDVLLPANQRLLDRLDLAAARHVLDVGSGVGSLLPSIAAVARSARVVAADRSFGMLRRADVAFPRVVADIRALPFNSGSFDVAVAAFMVQHLTDPLAAFSEVKRVLSRGGSFGVAMWGTVRDPRALDVMNEELDRLGAPPAPPFVSQDVAVKSAESVTSLLRQAGFVSVRVEPIEWIDDPDLDTFVERHTVLGASSRRIAGLDTASQRAFADSIRVRLAGLPAADFRDESEVLGVVAT